MNSPAIFGTLAAVFAVLAGVPYLRDVLRRKTTLERGAYTIWLILPITALVTQMIDGAQGSIGLAAGDLLVAVVFFGLSFRFGYKGVAKRDKVALLIAGLGIVISIVSRQPIVALIGALLADVIGSLLVTMKAYESPKTETTSAWILYAIAAICGLLALSKFQLIDAIYPIYALFASIVVLISQQVGFRKTQQ